MFDQSDDLFLSGAFAPRVAWRLGRSPSTSRQLPHRRARPSGMNSLQTSSSRRNESYSFPTTPIGCSHPILATKTFT